MRIPRRKAAKKTIKFKPAKELADKVNH